MIIFQLDCNRYPLDCSRLRARVVALEWRVHYLCFFARRMQISYIASLCSCRLQEAENLLTRANDCSSSSGGLTGSESLTPAPHWAVISHRPLARGRLRR